MECYIWKAE